MASIPQNVSPSTRKRNPDLYPDPSKVTVTAKSMLDDTPESKLHWAIIQYCKLHRWVYFHGSMAHKAMRVPGEPDFTILASAGRVFFIECKTKSGKLSPEQRALQVAAKYNGHEIHVVRRWDEFLKIVG